MFLVAKNALQYSWSRKLESLSVGKLILWYILDSNPEIISSYFFGGNKYMYKGFGHVLCFCQWWILWMMFCRQGCVWGVLQEGLG